MTKKTIEHDVREVSMDVDHGGPLLIWDDDPGSKIKTGMIIDTFFCSDPECRAVHIHAILVDKQLENVKSESAQILSDYFDSITKKTFLPNQSLQASFDVETEEFRIQGDTDDQSENKELLSLIDKQIRKGLSDIFKRRWRVAKHKMKDAWKEKDWSWWQPGDLVGWNDVFPDDFHFIFFLCGKKYIAIDNYCITPGCRCNDVAISFLNMDEKNELGAVFTDTMKLNVQDVHSQKSSKQELLKCWGQLKTVYPDLKIKLQKRHKEIKRFGCEIARISGNFTAPVVTEKKVNRNDPCPCGSGKKFKKCCMDR
jgi:hypothetical protein